MRFFIIIFLFFSFCIVNAQTFGKSTDLKLPRFVSTKTDESNLRVGASTDFPIKLTYVIKNFPVKIFKEYEDWRKIIDIDGNIGWMQDGLEVRITVHNFP